MENLNSFNGMMLPIAAPPVTLGSQLPDLTAKYPDALFSSNLERASKMPFYDNDATRMHNENYVQYGCLGEAGEFRKVIECRPIKATSSFYSSLVSEHIRDVMQGTTTYLSFSECFGAQGANDALGPFRKFSEQTADDRVERRQFPMNAHQYYPNI